jgi:hypothetical protein
MLDAPYYAIYNVGPYTFAPFKVLWAEQSGNFCAAVAGSAETPLSGNRPFVPDHKIFFVDFQEEEAAYFLCGLLTAPLVKEFVESHNISIQVGDIFKHMNLPPFNAKKTEHRRLARLAKAAHGEHKKASREAIVGEVEAEADAILESLLAPDITGRG